MSWHFSQALEADDDQPSDERVMKSYVWHGDQCFFVSTIERTSSAAADPSRFNETMVWTYDWDKRERGGVVHQDADSKGSIRIHMKVCQDFFTHGKGNDET